MTGAQEQSSFEQAGGVMVERSLRCRSKRCRFEVTLKKVSLFGVGGGKGETDSLAAYRVPGVLC